MDQRQTGLLRYAGAACGVAILDLCPAAAWAHVKWFCTIVDVTSPPVPLVRVISPLFLICAAGFAGLVFAGLLADGWVARLWPNWLSRGERLCAVEEAVVRIGIGAYCLMLWDRTAVVPWGHAGSILTPELLDPDRIVGALQIAVAAFVVRRGTCLFAAMCLAALIGVGIARYGAFSMLDYTYFAGFTAYLALTPARSARVRAWRMPLLGGSLAFGLMWTAIEKFLYPQWTAQVLVEHPILTLGFPVATVVVIAGFVELSLAFYLLAGRGLLRLGVLVLLTVFLSAIPEFGVLDEVGHLPIIAILLAMALHGTTGLHDALRLPARGPAVNAGAVTLLFGATLAAMMALYYGLQLTAVRPAS